MAHILLLIYIYLLCMRLLLIYYKLVLVLVLLGNMSIYVRSRQIKMVYCYVSLQYTCMTTSRKFRLWPIAFMPHVRGCMSKQCREALNLLCQLKCCFESLQRLTVFLNEPFERTFIVRAIFSVFEWFV